MAPMKDAVTFEIPGKPMTWSRTAVNFGSGRKAQARFITPTDRRNRMAVIADLWNRLGEPRFEKNVWLGMTCEFIFDRPQNHFGTGRNAGVLKERHRHDRPTSGVNGGDLDNLVKLIGDALNGVAYRDDAQIVELVARKRYAEPGEVCATRVTLTPLVEANMELPMPVEEPRQLELVAA